MSVNELKWLEVLRIFGIISHLKMNLQYLAKAAGEALGSLLEGLCEFIDVKIPVKRLSH
jgi:hypothetical protein